MGCDFTFVSGLGIEGVGVDHLLSSSSIARTLELYLCQALEHPHSPNSKTDRVYRSWLVQGVGLIHFIVLLRGRGGGV